MTLREVMLKYTVPELSKNLAVLFDCRESPALNEEIADRVEKLLEIVKKMPPSAEKSSDFLIPVFAEEEGVYEFYIELINLASLLFDFAPIKAWDEIDIDICYDLLIGPHLLPSFWKLDFSKLAGLAINIIRVRPLPVKWNITDFHRILNANVYGNIPDVVAERIAARYLQETGFPYGYVSTHLPSGNFSIPRNGPDPWDELDEEDFNIFRGNLFSWISYYQELRDMRKDLLLEINSKG